MENMEQQAAQALLNKGVKVPVTAPLLFRLFGIKTFSLVIRRPYLGTNYRISEIYLSAGLTDEHLANIDDASAHAVVRDHGKAISRIIAAAWLNGYISGKLFTGIVAFWLRWKLDNVVLLWTMRVLVSLCGHAAFTSTIRLAASMKMTAPNLSQEVQGS